jgi:heptosyltransferase II
VSTLTTGTESLVIAPQWLGDAVMTEPLLRRLAARGERVSVAALPAVAAVYRCMPQVAEVIELPFAHGRLDFGARRRLGRELAGRFAAAYVLPNSLKAALLPWLASIPKRVGYLGEARVGLLTHRLPNPAKGTRPAMVPFYSALSGDANVAADKPRLQVPEADATTFLQAHGLQPQGYHVLAPGSEYGSAKRWPAAHYAALAAELIARHQQSVVLLGSPKEAPIGAEVAAGQSQVIDLTGKTPLSAAFAAIAKARSVVSNDSGLMHVAAALAIPQVAVFGSSSPEHTPPLSAAAQVIWLKADATYQPALDCAPCFQRECPLGHTRCLTDVSPKRALQSHALLNL